MNLFVKIAKKGGILVHRYPTDDVAGKPRWRLTWRAGPPRCYDVALRPRGRTRVAHAGGAPNVHVSRSREEIIGHLLGESSPLFNHVLPLYFFRVGLCSHTILTLQATWRLGGRRIGSEQRRSHGPESTRSPDQTRA